MKARVRTKDRLLVDDVKASPVDRELAVVRSAILGFGLPIVAVAWIGDGLLSRGSRGPGALVRRLFVRDAGF
jgi:hypothetical protein